MEKTNVRRRHVYCDVNREVEEKKEKKEDKKEEKENL